MSLEQPDHPLQYNWSIRRRAARMAPLWHLRETPLRVLDLGGTPNFWLNQPHSWHLCWRITLLNLWVDRRRPDFRTIQMDATEFDAPSVRDSGYDLVFSNSLIEHLGTWRKKRKLADQVLATGLPYFVQTPSFWFPVEPHWLIPGFQFLPRPAQVALLARRSHAFRTAGSWEEAQAFVDEIDLLTAGDVLQLFPGCELVRERVLGLTKSYVAIDLKHLCPLQGSAPYHPSPSALPIWLAAA